MSNESHFNGDVDWMVGQPMNKACNEEGHCEEHVASDYDEDRDGNFALHGAVPQLPHFVAGPGWVAARVITFGLDGSGSVYVTCSVCFTWSCARVSWHSGSFACR